MRHRDQECVHSSSGIHGTPSNRTKENTSMLAVYYTSPIVAVMLSSLWSLARLLRSLRRPTTASNLVLTRRVNISVKTGDYQTLLVCVVRRRPPPPRPQVRQEMMMPNSETMALMMAFSPAAMALTMAMMQLPIVRKTDLIWWVLEKVMCQV